MIINVRARTALGKQRYLFLYIGKRIELNLSKLILYAELVKAEVKKASEGDRGYILTFVTHQKEALAVAMTDLHTCFKLVIEEHDPEE